MPDDNENISTDMIVFMFLIVRFCGHPRASRDPCANLNRRLGSYRDCGHRLPRSNRMARAASKAPLKIIKVA